MSVNVGARLQVVRKMKGLSQRELAKRAGVTNSTISLIEQNRVSPSVGSLKKVLDGIPMSLAEFFSLELESTAGEAFYPADEQPDLGSDGSRRFLVGAGRQNRRMAIFREVMPPGTDTGEVRDSHEGEKGGIVIQGRLELTVGGETRVLGPGDGYYFETRLPHRLRSVGEGDLVTVSANTPPVS